MKYYVTTPIYYVNDVPHIGHAYTTIAADVVARWHRLQGHEVFFLTGTDEHGAKIAQAAATHQEPPQGYCDRIAAQFQADWRTLGISNDFFIRTTATAHQRGVQTFLQGLYEKQYIYKARYTGKYCVSCERFLLDDELVDGLCPDHRIPPQEHAEENYFFRLSAFREPLIHALTNDRDPHHFTIAPPERHHEVLGKLKVALADISISRASLAWGIPIPWDSSQTTYVWIDALLNYITALGYPDERSRIDRPVVSNVERWWPADLHLMAKDILWFHAVIWPALLLAAGLPVPRKIFAHGFFTVNGQKMSKTIGNVIRPEELIQRFGVDGTRYLLLAAFPFGSDGDFSLATLETMYNATLANNLGNLVSRVATMVDKYLQGRVPENAAGPIVGEVERRLRAVGAAFDTLKFFEALTAISQVADSINQYLETQAPWRLAKESPDRLPAVLGDVLRCLWLLALYLAPIMPTAAQTIWTQIGEEGHLTETAPRWLSQPPDRRPPPGPPAGRIVRPPSPLFPRLGT
ncbi:MAG: methionine--tRNA ligase [Elusimicrobia bacterium]|nr:methionine--tRNA ligase [Elusimicrobiota bacterium]